MSIVLMDFHAQTVQESLKEMLKIPGVEDAKVNFGASKISVYGEATVEELEKAGAFENLKVAPEKPRRQAPQEVKKDKIYIVLKGFHAQTVQESLKEMLKNSGSRGCKSKFWSIKISVYGEATIEELEKAGAFENLKVASEKPVRQATQEINQEKEDEKRRKSAIL